MPTHHTLSVSTPGRGFTDLTPRLRTLVQGFPDARLVHLFIRHTSASLIVQENADPDVLRDLETWMSDLVTDGDPRFRHRDEGPDDMSAHVRATLTATSLTVPAEHGRLLLGTWQAVYLWEHRTGPKQREVVVTLT